MPDAPDAAPVPIGYAPAAGRRSRVLRRLRPGTAGFFLLMTLLIAAGAWGGWKAALARDRKAFEACSRWDGSTGIEFSHPPSRGAMRHLARLPGGPWGIHLNWPAADGPGVPEGLAAVNARIFVVGSGVDADALLAELARPGDVQKTLPYLDLGGTKVTDAGLAALARPDSGLTALTSLDLRVTAVTDAGVAMLARPDSGLKALTGLDLASTLITDAGLAALARPDSGLKALAGLNLNTTHVTGAGLAALARPDSGLKALAALSLHGTHVTDAGLAALARPDSGLKALAWLNLRYTDVTAAGIQALRQARPSLQIVH